jgi:hypothetical protein
MLDLMIKLQGCFGLSNLVVSYEYLKFLTIKTYVIPYYWSIMKKLLFNSLFFIVLFFCCNCSMRTVTMNAMRPAEITFPSYVNTLVLVDRTKFDNKNVNIIEGVLTGELPGEDKANLQESMNALQTTLLLSPRFQVKKAAEIYTGNSITSAFPDQLPWNLIENICKNYNAEAVVAFEVFDTDFIVTDGKKKVKKQVTGENGVKKEIEVDEYFAKGVGNVTIGLRLYDPRAKTIVDQQLFTTTNTWSATGTSVADAVAHLIRKADATRSVSSSAGSNYAYKIAPMPIRISREFYPKSRKTPALTIGTRLADVNKWKEAADTWERGLGTARIKDAGRLCYNIAIAYEVMGDLQTAKQWVSKAYVNYGNKKARQYSSFLDYRIIENERVKEQMN